MQEFNAVPPERMTDTEAQEVMRMLAERRQLHEAAQSLPTVADVATLASSTPEEVREALADLRAKQFVQSYAEAEPVKAKIDHRRLYLGGLAAFALIAIIAMLVGTITTQHATSDAPAIATTLPPTPEAVGTTGAVATGTTNAPEAMGQPAIAR